MGNIVQRRNFDESLDRIRSFSNELPEVPEIREVEVDGGLFGWGNHKVTGIELNSRMRSIQHLFVEQNNHMIRIIKEFKEVYSTFDYLDKEYIYGILCSLDASNEALKRNTETQEDLKRTIAGLTLTVSKLKDFKEETKADIVGVKRDFAELDRVFNNLLKGFQKDELIQLNENFKSLEQLFFDKNQTVFDEILNQKEGLSIVKQQLNKSVEQASKRFLWMNICLGISIFMNISLFALLLSIVL